MSPIGTTVPRYFSTSAGCDFNASEMGQKITPTLDNSSLNVVPTETLSNTSSDRIDQRDQSNSDVQKLLSQPYKYGFTTDVEVEEFPKGINEDIIRLISIKKEEPQFMLDFRLRAFSYWQKMIAPNWASLHYTDIDYQNILYYSAPKKKETLSSLDEVDEDILSTFEKLGIPLTEQKKLANVAVDAIFDSVSVGTTFKEELSKVCLLYTSPSPRD